jgi:hypothetical protein
MRMRKLVYAAYVSLAVTMFALPNAAHAATHNILIPSSGGQLMIGMVSGDAKAAFKPAGSASCSTWWDLGTGAGLDGYVKVTGTSGKDTINVPTSSTSFCGATFGAIVLNGNALEVFAGAGNDTIQGKATKIYCDDGNDFVWGANGTTLEIYGESGNDHLYGGAGYMHGGPNDDVFCSYNLNPLPDIYGGFGSDTACGQFGSALDIDYNNTSPQCPGACNIL